MFKRCAVAINRNDKIVITALAMCLHRVANGEELETPLVYPRRTRSHRQPA